jgi:hypothetical protein
MLMLVSDNMDWWFIFKAKLRSVAQFITCFPAAIVCGCLKLIYLVLNAELKTSSTHVFHSQEREQVDVVVLLRMREKLYFAL